MFLMFCFIAPSVGGRAHLLPVVSDRRQDGAERLEAHGDVQQMSSKEEVVEVSKNGHGGVPDQIQEVLKKGIQISKNLLESLTICFNNISNKPTSGQKILKFLLLVCD